MSPPVFDKIGESIKEFTTENVYWNVGAFKVQLKSPDGMFCSSSLQIWPAQFMSGKMAQYEANHRGIFSSKLIIPHKSSKFAFKFLYPATFGVTANLALFGKSFYQEVSGVVTNISARTESNSPFKDPSLACKSSYLTENTMTELVATCGGKKLKTYAAFVVSKNNLALGTRFGISISEPSHRYLDLAFGYISSFLEAFCSISMGTQSLYIKSVSYGIIRRHQKMDFGIYSTHNKINCQQDVTLSLCYKPNSSCFLKLCATNERLFSLNYGFLFSEGMTSTLGFACDFSNADPYANFTSSLSVDI